MSRHFSFKQRMQSFSFAFQGIVFLLRSQHNAWIHLVATVVVIGLGIYFNVSYTHWLFLVVAMAMVWIAEAINTAIEVLCDHVTKDPHPMIKNCKDVAAGAVLLSAIGALVIGLIVFLPYITAVQR